jgi:AcrR family transcriptional regulator
MEESKPQRSIDGHRLEALCEALRKGCTRRQAITSAGLSATTFYRHLKGDSDLRQLVEDAEAFSIATVENALWKSATGGNVTAQIFYLINRAPDAWKDRQTLATIAAAAAAGGDNEPDPAAVRKAFNQLTGEALEALQERESRLLADVYPAALARLREAGVWAPATPLASVAEDDQ